MKMLLSLLASCLCVLLTFSIAQADREFADIYTECGLGAMIAPNNEAVAAVTNVTWDLGTTAISSNSSSPESCQGGSETSAALIYDAYPNLEKDLALGSGEYLSALLKVAGCEVEAQADISTSLRNDFAPLVRADDYSTQTRFEKAENLFDLVTNRITSDYSSVCAIS